MSEAYLSMQTNLGFTTEHGVPRSIGVTSTRPGEGKTTTAFALSQSLARTGKRVLLIDADMRSPSIRRLARSPASNARPRISRSRTRCRRCWSASRPTSS